MAVFMVEFSYGLAPPIMEFSVGKPQLNIREVCGQAEGLGASLNAIQGDPRTSSELASERYKKQRSERSELGSERYKKPQRSARSLPAVHGALCRQEASSTGLRCLGREQTCRETLP